MTNGKSGGGGRGMANDGFRPLPSQPTQRGHQPHPASAPGKIQGGYQAPGGGGTPAVPTTGSGVKPAPAAPSGGKK